ncbi:hypothetical protein [Paenibacillus sp. IHBB 10380]|uniref:hypothetical protein n=1 Tax=Paenibacillus sp. IHBB 10380 TaxID=1566358 RepID=UPI0005CF941A|nr:hypothetical protein [Paenibacillus sp. IHBB 10380]AJS58991.1 hypothetical protein UB51_11510 [Paenibacillus sp. IHBB 10380]
MKISISKYLTLLLILLLLITGYKSYESNRATQNLQDNIDNTFKYQLSNVLSSLSMKVNDYTYRSILASVSNVASLSELTSFEDNNDNLDITLNNLYISLREERSKDKVLSRIDELREIFFVLVQDPTSKEATDKLIKITNDTFFNVKD